MRQIKVNEIKPNMTIRWTHNKVTYECPVMDRDDTDKDGGVLCHVTEVHSQYVHPEVEEVTVVSEPQPEEPTTFGARVIVAGRKIIRVMGDSDDNFAWEGEDSNGGYRSYTWAGICLLGSVTVLPDQGWGVPGNAEPAPEVPDQIKEWPEDDTHLREYRWRDMYGDVWVYVDGVWRWNTHPYGDYKTPVGGPWFLTTATHTNKENA